MTDQGDLAYFFLFFCRLRFRRGSGRLLEGILRMFSIDLKTSSLVGGFERK